MEVKIISEGSNTGDSIALPMYGGGFIMANERRIYIKFICN